MVNGTGLLQQRVPQTVICKRHHEIIARTNSVAYAIYQIADHIREYSGCKGQVEMFPTSNIPKEWMDYIQPSGKAEKKY